MMNPNIMTDDILSAAVIRKLYFSLAAANPDLPVKPTADQLSGLAYAISLLDNIEQISIISFLAESVSPEAERTYARISAQDVTHTRKTALSKLHRPTKWDYIRYGIAGNLRIQVAKSRQKGYHAGYCDGYRAGSGESGGVSEPGALDSPIEMLGLSTGAFNCLSRIGVRYIREVTELEDRQIRSMRNLGAKRAAEIASALEKAGIRHTAWSRYAVPGENKR